MAREGACQPSSARRGIGEFPAAGAHDGPEHLAEVVAGGQPGERRPEPLGVRPVGASEEEAQPHEVAHEPRGDQRRTEVVADLGRSAHEGRLVDDPLPLAGNEPGLDIGREPTERPSQRPQLTEAVVVHGSSDDAEQPLLRHDEPVDGLHAAPRIEADLGREPLGEGGHRDVVLGGSLPVAEPHRTPAELGGKPRLHLRAGAVDVDGVDQDDEAWSPAVVHRAGGVVAEDVGTPAEQSSAVSHTTEKAGDHIGVEGSVQLERRDELHGPILVAARTLRTGHRLVAEDHRVRWGIRMDASRASRSARSCCDVCGKSDALITIRVRSTSTIHSWWCWFGPCAQ